jgi:hypothetical protein
MAARELNPLIYMLTGGYQVTDGRVTQYLQKEKWEVIISMIEIIYFLGNSLLNGVSRKHNNLKLSCLSQGVVKVVGYCVQE